MGNKSKNTHSRKFISLNKSEVYTHSATLSKLCSEHYFSLLSRYEFYKLMHPLFRLNSLISQACTVIGQPTYASYIRLAARTLRDIKEDLVSPTPQILEQINVLEIIFIKIIKKQGGHNDEDITI